MINMGDSFFRFEKHSNVLFVFYGYANNSHLYIVYKEHKPKKGETGAALDFLLKNKSLVDTKFEESNYVLPKMEFKYIIIDKGFKDFVFAEIENTLTENGIKFEIDTENKNWYGKAYGLKKSMVLGDPDFNEPSLDKKVINLLNKAVKDKLIYKPDYGFFGVGIKPKLIGEKSKIFHMHNSNYVGPYTAPGFISGMENGVRDKELFCAGSGPTSFYSMEDGDLFIKNYKKFKSLTNKLQKLGLEVYCNLWMDGGYRLAAFKR